MRFVGYHKRLRGGAVGGEIIHSCVDHVNVPFWVRHVVSTVAVAGWGVRDPCTAFRITFPYTAAQRFTGCDALRESALHCYVCDKVKVAKRTNSTLVRTSEGYRLQPYVFLLQSPVH